MFASLINALCISYPARLAGLSASVELTSRGIQLKFAGFSDKMDEFVKVVVNAFANFSPEEAAFARYKELTLQELSVNLNTFTYFYPL